MKSFVTRLFWIVIGLVSFPLWFFTALFILALYVVKKVVDEVASALSRSDQEIRPTQDVQLAR